jgi:hypothetical protein
MSIAFLLLLSSGSYAQFTITSAVTQSLPTPSFDPEPTFILPDFPPPSPTPFQQRTPTALNFYFLLLFLLIVFVVIVYLLVRRKKNAKRALARHQGRDALTQDLERWGHPQLGQSQQRPLPVTGETEAQRREDGLDERGEAPPPYVKEVVIEGERVDAGLAVPPRSLQRETGESSTPPGYEEVTMRGREEVDVARVEDRRT